MKKILTVLFILLFSVSVFAGTVENNLRDKVRELTGQVNDLTNQLEESTTILISLVDENKTITDENKVLTKTIEEKEGTITELIEALEESTELIIELKERIEEDQVEIERLRKVIKDIVPDIDNFKMVELGIGGTYPWGGKVLVGFNIPSTQIGIFADCAVFSNNGVLQVLVGVGIKFRF